MLKELMAPFPLLAVMAWVVAMSVDSGGATTAARLLIGISLILLTVISLTAVILNGSRWALRALWACLSVGLVIGTLRPIDPWWWLALILSILGIVAIAGPPLSSQVRKLPAATGPPTESVLLVLVLIATPLLLGFAMWEVSASAAVWLGISALPVALLYAKTIFGGLALARYLWPALALLTAFLIDSPARWVAGILAVTVAWLAWTKPAHVAFNPPRERSSVYPIPPELTPTEVLDSAGLDHRGKKR